MQKINVKLDNRVETDALQFNDDLPGVFIRGDNALFYAMQLRHVVKYVEESADHIDFYALNTTKKLIDLLDSCAIVTTIDDTDVGC